MVGGSQSETQVEKKVLASNPIMEVRPFVDIQTHLLRLQSPSSMIFVNLRLTYSCTVKPVFKGCPRDIQMLTFMCCFAMAFIDRLSLYRGVFKGMVDYWPLYGGQSTIATTHWYIIFCLL